MTAKHTRNDCYFCDEEERLQEHHIVPRRFDGADESENVVMLCPTCHDKLERLYDKRFYEELGVRKEVETLDGEKCNADGCGADATQRIESAVNSAYICVCDDHARCGARGCDNEPVVRPEWDDEESAFLLCDSHGICGRGGCRSTDTYVVDSVTRRSQCMAHIVEGGLDA